MHVVAIDPGILRRIERRRGRLHLYDRITAARTALLVIDMQDHFVAPGHPGEVPAARGIVANINRLAAALRESGGTVVWITTTFSPAVATEWSVFLDGFYSAEKRQEVLRSLAAGGPGHALFPAMEVRATDWRVDKTRFSAFIQGASPLEEKLRHAGIDMVLITGTLTHVCCESTARDAMMRNFKVVMLADGNATYTDAEHNASLGALFQVICDVMTTDEAIARLIPAEDA